MLTQIKLKSYYTPFSSSLDINDPVWKAWRIMKKEGTRVLPVNRAGQVVGMVSDRDIIQISGQNGGQSMPVKEAMSLDPLVMSMESSINDLLSAMLKKDQQNAIIINSYGEVCGLFPWTSALQFFLDFNFSAEDSKQQSS